MAIATVRRLAADILGVGESRIRISPDNIKEVEGALTRADVKGLIGKGFITRKELNGRASTVKRERRSSGHRRGLVIDSKSAWMEKVRAQRRFLRLLVADGAVRQGSKRSLYGKIKSGIFRNKRAMLLYLKDNGLVARDYEPKKPAFERKAPAVQQKPAGHKPAAAAAQPASASHEHKPGEHKGEVHREAQAAADKKGERK
jgi:large subunit ribosomal protein L19e